MTHRLTFLLMGIVQVAFAIQAIFRPQAARAENIKRKTIYAKMPLPVYGAVGLVCAGAAILFFYMFLYPPSR